MQNLSEMVTITAVLRLLCLPVTATIRVVSVLGVFICTSFWALLVWLYQHALSRQSLEVHRRENELRAATTYDAWLQIAQRLDDLLGADVWKRSLRMNDSSAFSLPFQMAASDQLYRDLLERTNLVLETFQSGDNTTFTDLLRDGAVRNPFGIARSQMYEKTYTGTKIAIEGYVKAMVDRIEWFADGNGHDVPRNRRQYIAEQLDGALTILGRTVLVLQGGGLFALSHLGVMRGLLSQGLMPNVVFGTTTGAYFAAIAGVLTNEELANYLDQLEQPVDKTVRALREQNGQAIEPRADWELLFALRKGSRLQPFDQERDIFAELALDVVSPTMTFDEAYKRTGRILNIEIACDAPSTPNLLNYITTPNVLIFSAAEASQEDDYDRAADIVLERAFEGHHQPWALNDETPSFKKRRREANKQRSKGTAFMSMAGRKDDPLSRMEQMFDIKHHIMSQPRPYVFPFLRHSYWNRIQRPKLFPQVQSYIVRFATEYALKYLRQYAHAQGVPFREQQLLLAERCYGPKWNHLTVAPEASFKDLDKMVQEPSKEALMNWIMAGERSVWESRSALHVRMAVERAMERGLEAQGGG